MNLFSSGISQLIGVAVVVVGLACSSGAALLARRSLGRAGRDIAPMVRRAAATATPAVGTAQAAGTSLPAQI